MLVLNEVSALKSDFSRFTAEIQGHAKIQNEQDLTCGQTGVGLHPVILTGENICFP